MLASTAPLGASKDIERSSRAFARLLVCVGIVCLANPLADLVLDHWPPQPVEQAWRYQFLAALSQLLITPLIGVVFLAAAGVLRQRGLYLKVGGVVSLATGVLVLLLAVVFVVDGLQLQEVIGSGEIDVFQRSMIRGVAKSLMAAGGFLYVGYATWKAGGGGRRRRRKGAGTPKETDRSVIVMTSDPNVSRPSPGREGKAPVR